MIEISKEANKNYLAKVVRLGKLTKHPDADRLQTTQIDFQTVITGMDAKEGDYYIYFPVECKISDEFISHINGFRDSALNMDPDKKGFFDANCRVRALKLRGEKSMGFICPATELMSFATLSIGEVHDLEGKEFDTLKGMKLLEKYEIPTKNPSTNNKKGQQPKANRLVDGQVHLHVSTEQLVKNVHKIHPDDIISISYKTHGTSWWVSNVPVKKNLKWYEKALKWLGANIVDTEYDYVYGSRKVVKNRYLEPEKQGHYFGYDLWRDIMEEVQEFIPKNYTLYGECTGFTRDGAYIQKEYDYGCTDKQHKLEIYRITVTNPDGTVTELSTPEIIEFCDRVGLLTPLYFFYGKAKELVPDTDNFSEDLIKYLKNKYLEKPCFMCKNDVPAEGIVLRKENLFSFNAYKLKSFSFLEKETKQLDAEEADMESQN